MARSNEAFGELPRVSSWLTVNPAVAYWHGLVCPRRDRTIMSNPMNTVKPSLDAGHRSCLEWPDSRPRIYIPYEVTGAGPCSAGILADARIPCQVLIAIGAMLFAGRLAGAVPGFVSACTYTCALGVAWLHLRRKQRLKAANASVPETHEDKGIVASALARGNDLSVHRLRLELESLSMAELPAVCRRTVPAHLLGPSIFLGLLVSSGNPRWWYTLVGLIIVGGLAALIALAALYAEEIVIEPGRIRVIKKPYVPWRRPREQEITLNNRHAVLDFSGSQIVLRSTSGNVEPPDQVLLPGLAAPYRFAALVVLALVCGKTQSGTQG